MKPYPGKVLIGKEDSMTSAERKERCSCCHNEFQCDRINTEETRCFYFQKRRIMIMEIKEMLEDLKTMVEEKVSDLDVKDKLGDIKSRLEGIDLKDKLEDIKEKLDDMDLKDRLGDLKEKIGDLDIKEKIDEIREKLEKK